MRREPELAGMRAILALLALQMSCLARADTQSAPPGWTLDFFSPSPLLVLLVVIVIEAFLLRYMRIVRNQLSRALVDSQSDEKIRATVLSGYSDLPLEKPRAPAAAPTNQALQDPTVEHDALVGELVDQAAPNLPMVNVLARAVQVIGPVLGGSLSPVALITTLIGVGSKLGATAYAHWITRIMDLPYKPGQLSSKLFDSHAAIGVITQVPTLFKALGPQLAGDRTSAVDVVQLALGADDREALVNKYPQAFMGLAQPSIESAVRDLQKAALDFVLRQEVPPDAVKDVGGLASVLKAVDQVRGNHEASAALDLVMTTAKTLENNQLHPELVFTNAAFLLSTSNTAAAA